MELAGPLLQGGVEIVVGLFEFGQEGWFDLVLAVEGVLLVGDLKGLKGC